MAARLQSQLVFSMKTVMECLGTKKRRDRSIIKANYDACPSSLGDFVPNSGIDFESLPCAFCVCWEYRIMTVWASPMLGFMKAIESSPRPSSLVSTLYRDRRFLRSGASRSATVESAPACETKICFIDESSRQILHALS